MSDVASSPMPAGEPRPDVDLRARISSPLMNQGPRPLCVPFSLSLAHDALDGSDAAVDTAMAPEAVWWHCAQRGQTHPTGMALDHAGEALRDSGQPPLSQWPWNPNLGYKTENPPPVVGAPPWQQARTFVFEPAHDGVEDQIEDTLAAGYPSSWSSRSPTNSRTRPLTARSTSPTFEAPPGTTTPCWSSVPPPTPPRAGGC